MIYFLFQASLLTVSILNFAYWSDNPTVAMFVIGWCSSLTFDAIGRAIAKEFA
jgi:hypothetical protein